MMPDVDVAAELTPLILQGKIIHKWDCFGQIVIYELFPMGSREEIDVKTSGLDLVAKRTVTDIFNIAHVLTSVGKYNFNEKMEAKLQFIRAMQEPMFSLFLEEYRSAQLKQMEVFKEAREKLKKASPNQP